MATFMPPAGSPAKTGNEVMKFKIMIGARAILIHQVYSIAPNKSLCNLYILASVLAKYEAQVTEGKLCESDRTMTDRKCPWIHVPFRHLLHLRNARDSKNKLKNAFLPKASFGLQV